MILRILHPSGMFCCVAGNLTWPDVSNEVGVFIFNSWYVLDNLATPDDEGAAFIRNIVMCGVTHRPV